MKRTADILQTVAPLQKWHLLWFCTYDQANHCTFTEGATKPKDGAVPASLFRKYPHRSHRPEIYGDPWSRLLMSLLANRSLMPPMHTLSNEHLLPQDQIQRQILESIVYEQRLFSKSGTHYETGVHGDIFACDSFVGCVLLDMDRQHGTIARKHKFGEAAPLDAGQSTNRWWLPCHTKERLVISGGHGQISSRTTERLRTPPRGLDRSEPEREDTVRTSSRGG